MKSDTKPLRLEESEFQKLKESFSIQVAEVRELSRQIREML